MTDNYLERAKEFLDSSVHTDDTATLAPLFAQLSAAAALIDIAESLGALCGILIEALQLDDPS